MDEQQRQQLKDEARALRKAAENSISIKEKAWMRSRYEEIGRILEGKEQYAPPLMVRPPTVSPRPKQKQAFNPFTMLGFGFSIAGVFGLVHFWFVFSVAPEGSEYINADLINQRLIGVITCSSAVIVGAILFGTGEILRALKV